MTKCYVKTPVTCYCSGNAIGELCNLTKKQSQVLNPLLSSTASASEGNQLMQDLPGSWPRESEQA